MEVGSVAELETGCVTELEAGSVAEFLSEVSTEDLFGAGAYSIIRSRTFSTLRPVLAETGIISEGSQPKRLMISLETRSTSAAGRSTLLITGIMVRFCSIAR